MNDRAAVYVVAILLAALGGIYLSYHAWTSFIDWRIAVALSPQRNDPHVKMQRSGIMTSGWMPMYSAPRDGTVIEIVCLHGIVPWYGIFKWTTERGMLGSDGKMIMFSDATPTWVSATDASMSVFGDDEFWWRPYRGDPAHYVDPTNGAQKTDGYWRKAIEALLDDR